jgi:hypothetical protein
MRTAGWYGDPSRANDKRYWDGERWTDRVMNGNHEDRQPMRAGLSRTTTAASADPHAGLIKAGYWTSVLIWPVGLVIGIVLLTKNVVRQALIVLVVAVVVGAISISVFGAGGVADACIVTSNGNKVCGADAAAWCDVNAPIRDQVSGDPDADPFIAEQMRSTDDACDEVR